MITLELTPIRLLALRNNIMFMVPNKFEGNTSTKT